MTSFEFSQEQFSDMIYAAREATVRFKRARTEFRLGNEAYSHWDEETLAMEVSHYNNMEKFLCEKYKVAYGIDW